MNATLLNNTNTETQNVSPIDYNEMTDVLAHSVFPEVIENDNPMMVKMRKHRHPDCKTSNAKYMPDEDTFKFAMAWWFAPSQMLALGLHGETGTGKTELLMYIADRLNEPLYIEKITTGLTGERFEGGYDLVTDEQGNNVTTKRYSQAMTGYINGGLVLLDEVDKANDDLGTSLHLFAEGKPYTLSTFGETVLKHENCRISATANTTGGGGSDRYTSSQRLDSALRARFGWLETQFPSTSVEIEILINMYPALPTAFIARMVKTANLLRDALLGPNRDGVIDDPISSVFSTRTLVNWGYYIMAFGQKRPARASLEFAFFGSVDEDDSVIINTILQRVWAEDLNKPLSELLKGFNAKK